VKEFVEDINTIVGNCRLYNDGTTPGNNRVRLQGLAWHDHVRTALVMSCHLSFADMPCHDHVRLQSPGFQQYFLYADEFGILMALEFKALTSKIFAKPGVRPKPGVV